jgi:phosphatidate cytidylyltransferase
VADARPAADPAPKQPNKSGGDLALRVISAAALAPLALVAAYVGGPLFSLFWIIAGAGILWEWTQLVAAGRLGPSEKRLWLAGGALYAGVLAAAPILLRRDPEYGFVAVVMLFAVVWTTDIAAYFAGRLIGGPKLWPRASPKKTWSGALVGTVAAILAALAVARAAAIGNLAAIAVLSFLLSVASQLGDLFESAIKRRFGAKDASKLIPGHGGLMDRLDGFVAAAAVAAVIGLARGGLHAPSRGLLIW